MFFFTRYNFLRVSYDIIATIRFVIYFTSVIILNIFLYIFSRRLFPRVGVLLFFSRSVLGLVPPILLALAYCHFSLNLFFFNYFSPGELASSNSFKSFNFTLSCKCCCEQGSPLSTQRQVILTFSVLTFLQLPPAKSFP